MNVADTIDQGIVRIAPGVESQEVEVNANVTALCVHHKAVVFGLGDGRVLRLSNGEIAPIVRHDGVVTSLTTLADGEIVSAGQDGRVCVNGTKLLSAKDEWITSLCCNASKTRLAVAYGKRVEVIEDGQIIARLDDLPSTVTGIQFFETGDRIAISHYNGISLWEFSMLARSVVLTWRGSMTGVSISPDGRFVAGPTQDREIHIWDLVTEKDYRLGGYQRKVSNIGWTSDAPYLYSTGADVLVSWGLSSDPGTIPPIEIGYAFEQTVSAIIPTCKSTLMPAGYTDGSIIVGEVQKGTAKIVRRADGAAVTTLAEGPDKSFAFGTANGKVGVIKLQGGDMSHKITVCTSCRLNGSDIRPGKLLIRRLREAMLATDDQLPTDFEIGGAACLAGCKSSCTIAFQAKNKASYLFGNIEPDEDLGDIVDFAKDYALLADGWCSSVDRPGKLRTSTLARIPAFCETKS